MGERVKDAPRTLAEAMGWPEGWITLPDGRCAHIKLGPLDPPMRPDGQRFSGIFWNIGAPSYLLVFVPVPQGQPGVPFDV